MNFLWIVFTSLPLYLFWFLAAAAGFMKMKELGKPAKIVLGVSVLSLGELFFSNIFYGFISPRMWMELGGSAQYISLALSFLRACLIAILLAALVYAALGKRQS